MEITHADDPVLLAVHAIIIITGLVDCFFGYRAFRYAIAILLAIIGAGVGAYFAWQFADGSWTFSVIGMLLGGILGAVLSLFFFNAAVVITGASLGYVLMVPWLTEFAPWLQLLILVIGCGVLGLLSIVVARLAIMVATATTGAFRIIYGGWYLVGGPPILMLGAEPEAGWQVLAASQDAFIGMVALAGVGFFVQLFRERKTGRKESGATRK